VDTLLLAAYKGVLTVSGLLKMQEGPSFPKGYSH